MASFRGEFEWHGLSSVTSGSAFGDVVAVEDFSLDAADGEFIVFVGPSGCGKTTTMRIIAGLEVASEGEVLFDGKDMSDELPHDRDVAMVFQNYALFPHLNVFSNIAFGMRLRKVPKPEIEQRVRKTAQLLGIEATCCSEGRRSFRAVSGSAWRSAARSCASRASS